MSRALSREERLGLRLGRENRELAARDLLARTPREQWLPTLEEIGRDAAAARERGEAHLEAIALDFAARFAAAITREP